MFAPRAEFQLSTRRINSESACYADAMPLRSCRVSVRDVDGVAHEVEVSAETLFEAAAAGLAAFRQEGWAAAALTANATLRVEVQLPTVVHDVPLAALERWLRAPSTSPKDALAKQAWHRR